MRSKFLLLTSYFLALPLIFAAVILASLYTFHQNQVSLKKSWGITRSGAHYEALPQARASISVSTKARDARVEVLEEFFTQHDSPLVTYGKKFVSTSDKYNLDYRLLPAIAMQESNLCKKAPENSHNCWGFGIYGGKVTRFKDYNEAIETVAKGLAENYIAHGLKKPNEIMTKYTPSSNGSWAEGVNFFMEYIHTSL